MAIAAVATWTDDNLCLVEVLADDGARGLGQCAPYHAAITSEVLHGLVAPAALGADEEPIGVLIESIFESHYKFNGSFLCRALCGLDTALWDLAARRRGIPVCALAGGQPRAVPVYASSMRRDIAADEEAERMVRLRDAHGFRAFKGKVGPRRGGTADPARTPAVIAGLRHRLGDGAILVADANGSYAPVEALPVARQLADHGYAAFEEPCPHDELEQTAAMRTSGILPIAGGEQDHGLQLWRRLAATCYDLCQPDIGYVGGFHRALAIAAIADAAGRPTTPHTANRSLLQVFSLHLMCTIARPWDFLECSIESPAWVDGILRQPLVVRDGAIACPEGPGWGVEINPARLARMRHRVSTRSHP